MSAFTEFNFSAEPVPQGAILDQTYIREPDGALHHEMHKGVTWNVRAGGHKHSAGAAQGSLWTPECGNLGGPLQLTLQ